MQFIRKAAFATAGNLICVFLVQTNNIILSRVLGPDGIGQYRLWLTAGTIISTIVVMGIGTANIYFLNNLQFNINRVVTNSFKLLIVLAPLTTAIVWAIIYFYPGYFGPASFSLILLFSVSAGLGIGVILFRQILVSQFEIRKMVGIDLVQSSVLLSGGILLASLGNLTVSSALVITLFSSGISTQMLLIFLRKFIKLTHAFDWSLLRKTLKYGVKLSLSHSIYLFSAEIGFFILGYLKYGQFAALGFYSRAATIAGLILLIPNYIGPLLLSQWSTESGAQRARQVEAVTRVLILAGVITSIVIFFVGKYIIWLLYGKEFIAAQDALVLLAPSASAMSLNIVFVNLLNADGRAFANVMISACTLFIVAFTSLIFIPMFGIRGAALGALCGNIFSAFASFIFASKYCGINIRSCLTPSMADWSILCYAIITLIYKFKNSKLKVKRI